MRAWCLLLVAPMIAGAQFPAPQMSGILLELDANVSTGEFAVRAPDDQVYRFQFDARTSVQRDSFRGAINRLLPGDRVTVDSEPVAGSLLRHAVSVRVVADRPPEGLPETRLLTPERLFQLPNTPSLTFAGVVARLSGQSLVLRTREGEQTLLIRHDTRYLSNGDSVGAAALEPNMRVYVRAGRNIYEQVEAYQVIWGKILNPPGR